MGDSVSNVGQQNVSVDQGTHTCVHRFTGQYSWDNMNGTQNFGFDDGPAANQLGFDKSGTSTQQNASSFSATFDKLLAADTLWYWRASLTGYYRDFDTLLSFVSYAVTATASTPTSSAITPHTATIACNYFPNTNVSSATVWLEYRKLGDTTWITAGAQDTGKQGYAQLSISRNLSGLLASTTYQYRLSMTRNTSNATSFSSAISTFTTSADTPTVTTNAASNIGPTVATLNGTVSPNNINTRYRFKWGTSSGSYPNTTAFQGPSGGGSPIQFSAQITGLSPTTQYFYVAEAQYPDPNYGTSVLGTEVSFTSAPSATQARLSPNVINQERKYGVQTDIYFAVETPAATGSDHFFSGTPPWIAGDVVVSQDGGNFANVTNLPTQVGTVSLVTGPSPLYKLTLTAAEMSGADILVLLSDKAGTPKWRDLLIEIQTKLRLGQIDVDATQIGGNTDAMKLTGVGTGLGLNASGGTTATGDFGGGRGTLPQHQIRAGKLQGGGPFYATLDAGASTVNNIYNGCILGLVSGTGVGQSRVIVAYDGTSKQATVNRTWTPNPGNGTGFVIEPGNDAWMQPSAELAAVPAPTDPFGPKVQFVFQRFAFRRTRVVVTPTTWTDTMYKSDSVSAMATAPADDLGGAGDTFTVGKSV